MEVDTLAGDAAPAPAVAPSAGTASARQHPALPLRFEGSAAEYFRIWIVNVCLTILTLGIYSAWAKVRRNRYFYGSTRLDGSPFHYTANPIAILKGRLLLVPVFVAYMATSYLAPGYELIFWPVLLPVLPWVVVKARRFALANSVYRNIRFGFAAGYRDAVPPFLLVPLLVVITFGLAYPYFDYRKHRFLVDYARFGASEFSFAGRPGRFYLYYLAAGGAYLLASIVVSAVVFSVSMILMVNGADEGGATSKVPLWLGAVNLAGMGVLVMFAYAVFKSLSTNYVVRNIRLSDLQFESRLNPFALFWIYLSNTLAVLLSVGLLLPWAAVRTARYRVQCVTVRAPSGLSRFVAGEQGRAGATGQEAAEFLDLDLGL